MSQHIFVVEEQPKQENIDSLVAILNAQNEKLGFVWGPKPLAIFIRDSNDRLIGGITGNTNWEWLYINLLAVDQVFRNKGYGRKLIQMAEEEALKRGCLAVHVNTFSFQAIDFYRKVGYEVYGVLDDFPLGHKKYFLQKKLL